MSGVTISSLPSILMLTRGKSWLDASLTSPPSAARVFVQGDRLTAAVEVYPPQENSNVEMSADILGADGVLIRKLEPRAPVAARRDGRR